MEGAREVRRAVAHSTLHSKPLGVAAENVAGKEAASEPTQPVPETHFPSFRRRNNAALKGEYISNIIYL